ncbi:hypothetical protein [Epilithonimonas mollis]|uniref:Uncharacterized protein n=1 Tax=Epilithonimonas mollis TaxID=216903 RepID=A0A1M6N190_9FLAO|nr:hypothetical protein [Epilithonimonas mollis]SHJ89412.1 hypothetical protein SAMN05444371_0111 [Epilithonimonas mollis]
MKKLTLFFLLMLSTMFLAQVDQIYKHNGEIIKGTVKKLEDYSVVFTYENEDAENTIGKYAVEKIIYGKSGRTQDVTEKITVNGEDDWDNVVILEDKSYISGLTKKGEIKGKTGFVSLHTGNSADNKANKKLKMEAAKLKCPFVLLTAEKDINQSGASGPSFGAVQAIRRGLAYSY